jgi:hypothetical protein
VEQSFAGRERFLKFLVVLVHMHLTKMTGAQYAYSVYVKGK